MVLIVFTGFVFIPNANFSGLEKYSKAAASTECFESLAINSTITGGPGIVEIEQKDLINFESFDFNNINDKNDDDTSEEGFLRVSESR